MAIIYILCIGQPIVAAGIRATGHPTAAPNEARRPAPPAIQRLPIVDLCHATNTLRRIFPAEPRAHRALISVATELLRSKARCLMARLPAKITTSYKHNLVRVCGQSEGACAAPLSGAPMAQHRMNIREVRETEMHGYYLHFQFVGEVAEMLLLDGPTPRLLVDISVQPAIEGEQRQGGYPNRATFTITDPIIIERFLREMSTGDIAQASGSFSQSDYIPHRTTYIDTTFIMSDFRKIARPQAWREQWTRPALAPRATTLH
jgi:hypothetical protein